MGIHFLRMAVLIVCVLAAAQSARPGKQRHEDMTRLSVQRLAAYVGSADGARRVAATRELFRRGHRVLPALKRAGAKPMATIKPPRLDVVYSIVSDKLPGRYRADVLGIHVAHDLSYDALAAMGQRHGFTVPACAVADAARAPAVYVQMTPGRDLLRAMRDLLASEPDVTTLNLDCVE